MLNSLINYKMSYYLVMFQEFIQNSEQNIFKKTYRRRKAITKFREMWKFYQFAIIIPKIYQKKFIKVYRKYFYYKKKNRESIIRKMLYQTKTKEQFNKLNLQTIQQQKVKRQVYYEKKIKRNKILTSSIFKQITLSELTFDLSVSHIQQIQSNQKDQSIIQVNNILNTNKNKQLSTLNMKSNKKYMFRKKHYPKLQKMNLMYKKAKNYPKNKLSKNRKIIQFQRNPKNAEIQPLRKKEKRFHKIISKNKSLQHIIKDLKRKNGEIKICQLINDNKKQKQNVIQDINSSRQFLKLPKTIK